MNHLSKVIEHVAIIGGSGFVGRHLVHRLHTDGHRVTVLTRQAPPILSIEQTPIRGVQVDPQSTAALTEALSGITTLVNLVGILHQGGQQSFNAVHAELPARLVQACTKAGVARYLHMSALRADMNQPPSAYLRSKARGEMMAREASQQLAVIIFRPSIIFGEGDNFFGQFAKMLRWMPVFPLVCPNARFAPVWVDNVAGAFSAVINQPAQPGLRETYNLCGPRAYSFRELIRFTAGALGLPRLIVGLPNWMAQLQGRVLQHLPGPLFTLDNYYSLQSDSVCECNDLERLDIKPAALEAIMTSLLARKRSG
jgi:NADH dehydrogenase